MSFIDETELKQLLRVPRVQCILKHLELVGVERR